MQTPEQTIELVKKWLDKPESVSKEELRKAAVDASVFAQAAQAVASAASTAYVDFDETTGDVEWSVKEYEKLAHKEG